MSDMSEGSDHSEFDLQDASVSGSETYGRLTMLLAAFGGLLLFRRRALIRVTSDPLALVVGVFFAVIAGLSHTWVDSSLGAMFSDGVVPLLAVCVGASLVLWFFNRMVAGYSLRYLPFLAVVLYTMPLHWLFAWPSGALSADFVFQAHYEHWLRIAVFSYQSAIYLFFLKVYARFNFGRMALGFLVPLAIVGGISSCSHSITLMDFRGVEQSAEIATREALSRLTGIALFILASALFVVGTAMRKGVARTFFDEGYDFAANQRRSLEGKNGLIATCGRLSLRERLNLASGIARCVREDVHPSTRVARSLDAAALFIWLAEDEKEYWELGIAVKASLGLGSSADVKSWAIGYLNANAPHLTNQGLRSFSSSSDETL